MRKILIILIFIFSFNCFATPSERFGHIYIAGGELFGLSSVRVGGKSWEAGLLNRRSIGFVRVAYDNSLYLNYGGMINLNATPGIFGAMGYEKLLWNFLSLRAEINMGHAIDNYSSSEIHLGIGAFW